MGRVQGNGKFEKKKNILETDQVREPIADILTDSWWFTFLWCHPDCWPTSCCYISSLYARLQGSPKAIGQGDYFSKVSKICSSKIILVPTDGWWFGGKPYRIYDSSNSTTQPDICASLLQARNTGKRCSSAQNVSSILRYESLRANNTIGRHSCLLQKVHGGWLGSNRRGML